MTNKLDDLEKRLNEAKAKHAAQQPKPAQVNSGREMAAGIRAFMEMFGVLLATGGIGYGIDSWFGTAPTWLFIFIILGIITAIFNLYKLSRNLGTAIGSNGLQSADKMATKPAENESGDGVA